MKKLFIIILLLCFSIFTHGGVLAVSKSHSYSPKQHQSESDAPKNALIIYSIPEDEKQDYLQNIHRFISILESHWNVHISAVDYSEVDRSILDKFPYLIFIELNRETLASDLFASIARNTQAKTAWIGYGSEAFVSDSETMGLGVSTNEVFYKGVSFQTSPQFKVFTTHPDNLDDFTTLATFLDKDKQLKPLISIYQEKHILIPFVLPYYYQINDSSLPFIDVFHYLLGHHERSESQPALLRLEDVNVHTYQNPFNLIRAHKYLTGNNIPYHVAFIERYIDPQKGIDWSSSYSKRYLNTIKEIAQDEQVVLVQHGYTHQVRNEVSGIGFEFWDAQENGPLKFETPAYAENKIKDVRQAMASYDLPIPDIWETPHYQASEISYKVFEEYYSLRYEEIPDIGTLPFAVSVNNTVFFPENLGYISDSEEDLERIQATLRQLNTFEDPIASGFWHPWRKIPELEQYIQLIRNNGFEFVLAYDLLEDYGEASTAVTTLSWFDKMYFSDISFVALIVIFTTGAIIFFKNTYYVKKHLRLIKKFSSFMSKIEKELFQDKRKLPRLGIMIPARNESLVIGNTLRNVAGADYPKYKMKIFVIVDERELEANQVLTTKEVAQKTASELHQKYGKKFIYIVQVPKWYSGAFGSRVKNYAVSTKGRALNYCLQKVGKFNLDMIGVLDADGRLSKDVLKEVAYKRLRDKSKILQGSVFQVGNFSKARLVGVAASLELALHHLTELPIRLQKQGALQFLAGTNYFIDTQYIKDVKGWNHQALVEDAELALKLFVLKNTVGEWLYSPEIEQTPAKFQVYRKQRERWVRGYFIVLKQILNSPLKLSQKLYFTNKILFSQFRFIFDLGLPIASLAFIIYRPHLLLNPLILSYGIFLFILSFFVWDAYGFVYRSISSYIDPNMRLNKKIFISIRLFLFLPIFMIVQAIPRVEAIYNSLFYPENISWYKTERTAEARTT